MAEINPDPYKAGDPLGPIGRVTAIFSSLADLKSALPAIKNAGIKGDDTAVFIGAEGAVQLDASGEIRDIAGLKMFQNAVCDEAQLFEEFEQALAVAVPLNRTVSLAGSFVGVPLGDQFSGSSKSRLFAPVHVYCCAKTERKEANEINTKTDRPANFMRPMHMTEPLS
ncbi:MAG TPA: hypothetical protein VKX17_28230 [Planctomycetota bacterium]|nr:hypothetical protein [Planctomycetota bacterium]